MGSSAPCSRSRPPRSSPWLPPRAIPVSRRPFDGFIERWRYGTKNLVADAAQLAARLSDAEVAYTVVETTARLPNGMLGQTAGPDPAAR